MIKVANAPVSFGVFELTAGSQGFPDPDDLLGAVARGGYEGIDLGPLGYLGREDIAERLERHDLSLAGGWIAMRLASSTGFEDDLPALEDALDVFEAAAGLGGGLPPKPTLADAGSRSRWDNPGRGADMPELGLDDEGWATLAKNLARAAETCRARGLEPTFHHHACTYVEAPHEIERLLDATDIRLCLDSGHLVLGGGDPVDALRRWGDRINHIHVKDCRVGVLHDVIEAGEGMEAVWRRAAFCELGAGDVDVDGFLDGVRELGYAGWLVVEQDTMLVADSTLEEVAALQARNREFLRERGF
ncbi:TIM barrel protein [soil metagenome]